MTLSVLTFTFAKVEKEKKTELDSAKESSNEAVDSLSDGVGAKTEAGGSDFDIEQLLKLIDALKNQDYDKLDETLKDSKNHGFNFDKINHTPEEEVDASQVKMEEEVKPDEDEMAELDNMEL